VNPQSRSLVNPQSEIRNDAGGAVHMRRHGTPTVDCGKQIGRRRGRAWRQEVALGQQRARPGNLA
jgi:hypothetical protein